MPLAYPLLALALVVLALFIASVLAVAALSWLRWLWSHGTIALVSLSLVAAALVNMGVPRSCNDGEIPARQRPITAAVDSDGGCERMGVGQLALVPLAGVAGSLLVLRASPRPGQRVPAG